MLYNERAAAQTVKTFVKSIHYLFPFIGHAGGGNTTRAQESGDGPHAEEARGIFQLMELFYVTVILVVTLLETLIKTYFKNYFRFYKFY